MKFAKLILFVTNTLLFILGVAVVAAAGYVLGFNGDFDSVSPSFMTYLALGTGIVIILIAILACCATCNYTKKWAKVVLVVYSFLMFVVMAIIVCSGALVWMKRDELRGCETNAYGTTDCRDDQHLLRRFANETHYRCCVQANTKACTWVEPVVTQANCDDPTLWRQELWTYINEKLQPVAIVTIIVAVVQAITILATCWLMTQHDDHLVHPHGAMSSLPKESSGELPTKSKTVLLVVNFLLFILGACMIGFSAYLLDFKTEVGAAINSGGPAVGLATGALIVLLSIAGCIGATNWRKKWAKVLLFVYDLVLLVIICVEVIGAILIMMAMKDLEGCRDSPLGSSQCEDSTAAIRTWVNETRIDCCPVANRGNKECTWASDVLTDETCKDFETFKAALIAYANDRIIPIAIVVLLIALMQLVTFCSTCCLIKAKGKALVSGRMRQMYKQPGHFYDNSAQHVPQQHYGNAAAGGGGGGDAGEWATANDKHGRVYYYNKRTRETRWDPPPSLVV